MSDVTNLTPDEEVFDVIERLDGVGVTTIESYTDLDPIVVTAALKRLEDSGRVERGIRELSVSKRTILIWRVA